MKNSKTSTCHLQPSRTIFTYIFFSCFCVLLLNLLFCIFCSYCKCHVINICMYSTKAAKNIYICLFCSFFILLSYIFFLFSSFLYLAPSRSRSTVLSLQFEHVCNIHKVWWMNEILLFHSVNCFLPQCTFLIRFFLALHLCAFQTIKWKNC